MWLSDGTRHGKCTPCNRGLYQNKYGQEHCIPCPMGRTTPGTNSKSIIDCARSAPDAPLTGQSLRVAFL